MEVLSSRLRGVPIFEDPQPRIDGEVPISAERKVLGELPVNERMRMQSPTRSQGSAVSPPVSPGELTEGQSNGGRTGDRHDHSAE